MAQDLWPQVMDDLDEMNDLARKMLALGPRPAFTGRPQPLDFPWPSCVPTPGTWVRPAAGPVWHILGPQLCEYGIDRYGLAYLCGRAIDVWVDEPHGRRPRRGIEHAGEPSGRRCRSCERQLERLGGVPVGYVLRPWGDLGVDAYQSGGR